MSFTIGGSATVVTVSGSTNPSPTQVKSGQTPFLKSIQVSSSGSDQIDSTIGPSAGKDLYITELRVQTTSGSLKARVGPGTQNSTGTALDDSAFLFVEAQTESIRPEVPIKVEDGDTVGLYNFGGASNFNFTVIGWEE